MAQLRAESAGDDTLPATAVQALGVLGQEIDRIEARVAEADSKLMARHKATPESRLLAEVPGIGPIGALNMVLRVDASQFKSARHFAAWLGLTPRDHSTGGKQRMGGITRAGHTSALAPGSESFSQHTLQRRGRATEGPSTHALRGVGEGDG